MKSLTKEILSFLQSNGFDCSIMTCNDLELISTCSLATKHNHTILPLSIEAGSIEEAARLHENTEEAIRNITAQYSEYPLIITEDRWHLQPEAMQKRIYQNFDTFRSAWVEYYEHRSELHKQRVAFIFNLLAGDRPPCEFITNTPLENAPDNYTANCAARFQATYAAWQKYADCAVRMHCPAPSLQGNSTPEARDAMQLILQKHFEQFLTLLTGGLGR